MSFTVNVSKDQNSTMPEGIYDIECIEAKQDVSKSSGNDMLVLNFRVFRPDGSSFLLRDYFALTQKAKWKLANLIQALGFSTDEDLDVLSLDYEGKTCRASIIVDGDYNKIDKYIKPGQPVSVKEATDGDEIPF